MNHIIDKSITPFNDKESFIFFKNFDEVTIFQQIKNIKQKQEFYFMLENEPGIMFSSIYEYYLDYFF